MLSTPNANSRRPLVFALVLLGLGGQGCGSPFDQGVLPDAGGSVDSEVVTDGATGEGNDSGPPLPRFSFFYTSLDAMRRLSGNICSR